MTVLKADSLRLQRSSASSKRRHISRSASGVSAPQLRSSVSLAMQPSCIRSPRTRLINSSRTVSDSGIPITDRVYTRMPRKGNRDSKTCSGAGSRVRLVRELFASSPYSRSLAMRHAYMLGMPARSRSSDFVFLSYKWI